MKHLSSYQNKPFLLNGLNTMLHRKQTVETWSFDVKDSWAQELFRSGTPSVGLSYDKNTGSFAAYIRGKPLAGDMKLWSEFMDDDKVAIHVDMQAPRETIMRVINLKVLGESVTNYGLRCKVRQN